MNIRKKNNLSIWRICLALFLLAVLAALFFLKNHKLTQLGAVKEPNPDMDCSFLKDDPSKMACWTNQINLVMEASGVDAAMDKVSSLASTDPKFIGSCHAMMHLVGQKAYMLFTENKNFSVSPKITYCSYGFYHGFMEELLQQTGDLKKARDFCSYVNNKLARYNLDLSSECFHGIGHGSVADNNGQYYGNAVGLASFALDLCRKVANNSEELTQCSTGVFNGIGNAYTSGSGGLVIDKQNPLKLCKLQEEIFKPTCYGLMSRIYLRANSNDFFEAVKQGFSLTEKPYKDNVVSNIAALYVSTAAPNVNYASGLCESWSFATRDDCIKGISAGYFQSGAPGKEYEIPLQFCRSLINGKDKKTCYDKLLPDLKKLYYGQKLISVCSLVEDDYRSQCQEKELSK